VLYVPPPQDVHMVLPVPVPYVPAAQNAQEAKLWDPGTELYFPMGHSRQTANVFAPIVVLYVPAPQDVHEG